ncbi:Protein kinase domain [Dillenia turbinata]|uniref:RING-type E3 ubiquitin transferase n=1 Tax=Dillenia turbinata TaxID=194707 RepID=A0AAN8UIE4_9MAGN
MWLSKGHANVTAHVEKKNEGNGMIAVAINKNKGSRSALRWAIENLLSRGRTVILIHVLKKPSSRDAYGIAHAVSSPESHDKQINDLFLSFHCFCSRKDITCHDVVLEDTDVVKAIVEFSAYAAIENLILGASQHGLLRILKSSDIPISVLKTAPDFCTVYVITKQKISSVRNASHPAPFVSPLADQIQKHLSQKSMDRSRSNLGRSGRTPHKPHFNLHDDRESFKRLTGKIYGDLDAESGISFVSSGRPGSDRASSVGYDAMDYSPPRASTSSSERSSFASMHIGHKTNEHNEISSFSDQDSGISHCSSHDPNEMEEEMRRLKLQLKQTIDMYSNACKEALSAQQKAVELQRWQMEEERRLEEARHAEEAARAIAEKEKQKYRAALEAAEAQKRIAEMEMKKRVSAEMKALQVEEEAKTLMGSSHHLRCRKYNIEEIEEATEFFSETRKIGEGGYGPVFKCYLDHTPVAVKVEVLSCIRHPNIILLLGACPEYGCLVYEHLANGSLDDRLFCRGNTAPLSWQLRFRIAAEIATGLHFLHQSKPEPLVHRDLKPANILLDHNYVSKISDVGLARLVPSVAADSVTQYLMTSAAGTFCYIDPEYQQTGMLGVKSDVYSLGVMLMQLITGKTPMGLAHQVKGSIEKGTFHEMLDPNVTDWPFEEALSFAKIGVQCAEILRKDRPDLGKVVLPELNRLRELAEENMHHVMPSLTSTGPSPVHSQTSVGQTHSETQSSKNNSSICSMTEKEPEPAE